MTLEQLIGVKGEDIKRIAAKHGVYNVRVFASVARGDQTPRSDLNILVSLREPLGLEIVDLHEYLEELLGVKVDLVTEGAVIRKPLLWQSIREDLVMSKRDVRLFLHEMLQAIEKITSYTSGFTYAGFENTSLVQDAVLRNIEVIGEAARSIPREVQSRYAAIPWKQMVGFRDVAVHADFDVDLAEVWRIATEDLQGLRPQLQRMLDDLGGLPPLRDAR